MLPAGSRYGLAADAWGNESVVNLARQYPDEFVYFANELPDLPETRAVLEKYLEMGARGIGEQKFKVPCDSEEMQRVYSIAQEFDLPVLLRDEDHARGFLDRHQDRLLWASDCPDTLGEGDGCIGFKGLAAVRRLAPNPGAVCEILHDNAARLLKLA